MRPGIAQMGAGTILGSYRIDDVAGNGGMGVVYRATQLDLDRPVALKVIAQKFAHDDAFRGRFKAEAQLAALIDHPNIVPVYEAGETDGVLYLAMRYVDGTDLLALVESAGRLEPERAVHIVCQVAGALDAAHRRGLVHRDVKPPNVLITQDDGDHAYLTDFGLTKHVAAASGFTRTGQFVGTADFVSPEQIRGEQSDARGDVYALGCVLFHALTGHTPFARETEMGTIYAHLNDPVPAASDLAPAVPAALDAVIATAMAKAAEDRYASAGEMARAAKAALEGAPAPAQPSSASATAPPRPAGPAGWPRALRIALLVAVPSLLLIAAAVAVLGAAGALERDERGAPQSPATPPPVANEPKVVDTIAVGDGPDGVTADGDSVFVSHAREGTLVELNARTGKLRGDPVPVGANPDQIAAGKGAVWVVDSRGDQVQRLQTSPQLQATATIPVGFDAQAISLGPQLVWVANTGDDTVQRLDRAAAAPVGDPIGVGDHPIGIFVGSKVWVTNFRDGTLSKIDVATAQVEGPPLKVGEGARGVVEGMGSVWVSNLRDGTVARVDPAGSKVVATIAVGKRPKDIVVAHKFVWVVNSGSNTVSRIDPETNRLAGAPIPVGRNPIGIAASRRSLWVTNFADDTVSRIDP
jgi:YVTN family beta-propeller protein